MFHACAARFDVMGSFEKFWKQGLSKAFETRIGLKGKGQMDFSFLYFKKSKYFNSSISNKLTIKTYDGDFFIKL